jgi:hypothetical protein
MSQHQLYLNLGDNGYLVARCSCGWQQERMVELNQDPKEVEYELEQEFQRHAGLEPTLSTASAPPSA